MLQPSTTSSISWHLSGVISFYVVRAGQLYQKLVAQQNQAAQLHIFTDVGLRAGSHCLQAPYFKSPKPTERPKLLQTAPLPIHLCWEHKECSQICQPTKLGRRYSKLCFSFKRSVYPALIIIRSQHTTVGYVREKRSLPQPKLWRFRFTKGNYSLESGNQQRFQNKVNFVPFYKG